MLKDSTTKVSNKSPLISPKVWKSLRRGRIPGQVVVQYTDRCNASCVQCGMRTSNKFPRTKMNPDDVKRLIDAMVERGVEAVSFTGGEPLLCLDEISQLIQYAGRAGIKYIRTGTNGFIFKGADKPDFTDKIARIADILADSALNTFWISLDSADPVTHEKNRGFEGITAGIEKGLPLFHERGLYPAANLGINRCTGGGEPIPMGLPAEECYDRFRKAFRRFYVHAANLGFTMVNACYPMSFDEEEAEASAVYAATSTDDFIRFSHQEKPHVFRALFDTIPEFRHKLRIFTPRSSLKALIRQYEGDESRSYPCRGGIDFFFIDSKDMNTYPCGYRGSENMGKFWDLDLDGVDTTVNCKLCDWECFRDPSELLGPFAQFLSRPAGLSKKLFKDRFPLRVWLEDLQYYRACNYFNARTAPDWKRLSKFAPPA